MILALFHAVNHPKGTKNESNSQPSRVVLDTGEAVNHPKGTKNESNSQHRDILRTNIGSCKSP